MSIMFKKVFAIFATLVLSAVSAANTQKPSQHTPEQVSAAVSAVAEIPIPGVEENSKADANENSKADANENSKADANENSKADANENSKADANKNSKADANENSKADTNENSKADTNENSKADANENSKADANENSKADANENSKADANENSKADTNENSKADANENSKADANENSKAEPEDFNAPYSLGVESVEMFGLTAKESTEYDIAPATWVYVISQSTDGFYTIQWYDEAMQLPIEAVLEDTFTKDLPGDPASLRTAGIITQTGSPTSRVGTSSALMLEPEDLDVELLDTSSRGSYVMLTTQLHVREAVVPAGTIVLVWGATANGSVICWYDQYLVVPAGQLKATSFTRDQLQASGRKTAGIMYAPTVLPYTDIIWELNPSKYASVVTDAIIWYSLPVETVTVPAGTILQVFDFGESTQRFFIRYGDTIANIKKENVELLEKTSFSEEELARGRFEGVITKTP